MNRKKVSKDFFNGKDVVSIAKSMLGKVIETTIAGKITSGRIVETEAYSSISDRASHAYNGKRTLRNEHMYGQPGTIYVYICYGIHRMLNFVTNNIGIPDAVLIRAIEPLVGAEIMLSRTGKQTLTPTITRGPGNVAKALGIEKIHSGENIHQQSIFLFEDDNSIVLPDKIGVSSRIGVDGAGDDAFLPYRFYIKGNAFVSGKPTK